MSANAFTTPDFTEDRYRELLDAAGERFTFVSLHRPSGDGPRAIWRHDVDMSLHRARALARIEADRGVAAHYFIQTGSAFYNPFEPGSRDMIGEIAALGHEVGLHFDPTGAAGDSIAEVEAALGRDADALAGLLGRPVASFSLHNPTVSPHLNLEAETHAGLLNASAPALREAFDYCSDSNGVWRFRPLHEMIADREVTRLYALTHPVWWAPEPLAPRQRVQRAIDGRAAAAARGYDELLAAHKRPNIARSP